MLKNAKIGANQLCQLQQNLNLAFRGFVNVSLGLNECNFERGEVIFCKNKKLFFPIKNNAKHKCWFSTWTLGTIVLRLFEAINIQIVG